MMEYITKEFLIKQLKEIAKNTCTFDLADMYPLAQLYRGRLLCLMELLAEIDPDYKLDPTTNEYVDRIFAVDYLFPPTVADRMIKALKDIEEKRNKNEEEDG